MIEDTDLSRLLDGELDPATERTVQRALEADPALRERLAALRLITRELSELPVEPVPTELLRTTRDRMTAPAPARGRPALPTWLPWLLAAGLAGWIGGRPGPQPAEITLGPSTELTGQLQLTLPHAELSIDGQVRLTPTQEPPMDRTHLATALGGAGLAVLVQSGQATVRAPGAAPLILHAGEQTVLPAPAPPARRADPPTHATPAPLPLSAHTEAPPPDDELSRLRMENAVLRGQVAHFTGKPTPWPGDLPEPIRPDRFEASVTAALADFPGLTLHAIDCEEYPCFAVFTGEGSSEDGWQSEGRRLIDRLEHLSGDQAPLDALAMSLLNEDDDGAHATLAVALIAADGAPHQSELHARTQYRLDSRIGEWAPSRP